MHFLVRSGAIACSLILAGALGCGESMSPGSDRPVASLTPSIAATAPLAHVTFAAKDDNNDPTAVSWRVNGVPGGSSAAGTISSSGDYAAPATIPNGDSVVVSAVSTGDTTQRKSATVFFVPSLSQTGYYVELPRVVDAAHPATTRVFVVPTPDVASVVFLRSNGATQLTSVGNGVFLLELDGATALANFAPASLHAIAGQLDYRGSSGARLRIAGFGVNVRDASMPDVPVTAIASDAQRSAYILNLRSDEPLLGGGVNPALIARAIQILGDRFDFMAVVANVTSNHNRFYGAVRSDVRGIGLPLLDNSAGFGSNGKLRGVIHFPLDEYFDPGTALTHEIGHSWINFAVDPILHAGAPHWPMSSIANESVMGFSIGGAGGEGGTFPYALVALGGGSYRVETRPPSTVYSKWDLYAMGLIPADSVPDAAILPSTLAFSSLSPGFVTTAATYSIGSYVTSNGVREPAYGSAPTSFTVGTLVLSYGRLLTAGEMAYFDAAAARAERTSQFPVSIGFSTGALSSPFAFATGGRATLRARLE
jgi:hypothetical protein